jgi:hypothetical protein
LPCNLLTILTPVIKNRSVHNEGSELRLSSVIELFGSLK